MSSQADRGRAFAALHEAEPFVIANAWDAGSARILEALGFAALATTSSGLAASLGRLDGGATLDDVTAHIARLVAVTDLPISADLEDGYGPSPQAAAEAIRRAAEAGAVGGSIEDWDRDGHVLYPVAQAVERVAAASEAASSLGFRFTFTARAENHIRGNPDLDDTVTRLRAYVDAGADVVFAPGLRTPAEVRTVAAAVDRPLNVLALGGLSVSDIAQAGAQRISLGGALAMTAYDAMATAAERVRRDGDFSGLASSRRVREWLA